MKKFNFVIIDDDCLLHLPVIKYFKNYPNYTCVNVFYEAKDALLYLQEHDVDLIFLDIEMPEMNGFQFLEALTKKVYVVFLTAYAEKYSLTAHNYFYDKDLVIFTNKAQFSFYLPKILARFEKMYVEKEMIGIIHQLSKNEVNTFPKTTNDKPIPLVDIDFITVIGHNIVVRIKNGEEHVFRMNLSDLTNLLPKNIFLSINRSTIVNMFSITSFSDATISINEHHFIISTRKHKEVAEILREQQHLLCQSLN
jgi:DNA-binding LytR/AlgR family response regulator